MKIESQYKFKKYQHEKVIFFSKIHEFTVWRNEHHTESIGKVLKIRYHIWWQFYVLKNDVESHPNLIKI